MDDDARAAHLDDPLLLQLVEQAGDRFSRRAERAGKLLMGDVTADQDMIALPHAQSLGQLHHKCDDPAIHVLSGYLLQLQLKLAHLLAHIVDQLDRQGGDIQDELPESPARHDDQMGIGQRHRGLLVGVQGEKAGMREQVAALYEGHDLLLAFLIGTISFDQTVHEEIDRVSLAALMIDDRFALDALVPGKLRCLGQFILTQRLKDGDIPQQIVNAQDVRSLLQIFSRLYQRFDKLTICAFINRSKSRFCLQILSDCVTIGGVERTDPTSLASNLT